MYVLRVEYSFDSAHFLAGYEGKCANIHGHRWRVEVEIQSNDLINEGQLTGMITDFSDIKKDVRDILDYYDHALIIEEGTMRNETLQHLVEDGFRIVQVPFRPTAEMFARYFFDLIGSRGYSVKRVVVFETPGNSAAYECSGGK